jgi:hypothetical protein
MIKIALVVVCAVSISANVFLLMSKTSIKDAALVQQHSEGETFECRLDNLERGVRETDELLDACGFDLESRYMFAAALVSDVLTGSRRNGVRVKGRSKTGMFHM